MTLRSYDLDNIIFGLLIPENPYVDTKNLLLAWIGADIRKVPFLGQMTLKVP